MQFWTLALILLCSFPYKSGKWSKNVFMAYSSWSSSLLERSCHSNCGCRLVLVPASPSCQLPGNTGSPSVSYPADWASSAHTIFHHGFSYSWFQHNGCLFFTLELHLLPFGDHSSNKNLPFMFLFASNVTYMYRNCSVKYNHLLEQTTVLSQQQNSQLFRIYNEKQNSYLNNWGLYFNKWA